MKKIFAIALALLMALSLAACAKKTENSGTLYYGKLAMGGKTEQEMTDYFAKQNVADTGDTYDDGTAVAQWKGKYFDDLQSGILALQKGDIQEMDILKATADYIAAQNGNKYTVDTDEAFHDWMLSMALKQENKELLDKLNAAIAALQEEGKLEELEARYINTAEPDAMAIPEIEGAETIKVLVTGDQPPYDFVTADGQAAGYNIALLSEISQKIGMNIELVYANSGARFASLASGKVDVIFCTLGFVQADGTVSYEMDLPEDCTYTVAYARQNTAALQLAK